VWRLGARLHAIKQQTGRAGEVSSPSEIISTLCERRIDLLSCVGGIGVIIAGAVRAAAALSAAIRADLPSVITSSRAVDSAFEWLPGRRVR